MQVVSGVKILAVFILRAFIRPATEGFLHGSGAPSSVVDASARDFRASLAWILIDRCSIWDELPSSVEGQ